jgi:hypothetical protein
MAKIGLYYPFIHFQDVSWLKLSALYWDRMNRIVPRGYELHDQREVAELVDSEFVVNERPEEWASQTGQLFEKLLDQYLDQLAPRYDVRSAKTWPVLTHRRFASGRNPHLAYIHARKLPAKLHERLQQARLAVLEPQRDWLGMHPQLVRAYMLELAKRVARGRGAELVSAEESSFVGTTANDDDLARALLRKVDLEHGSGFSENADHSVFTLAIQMVVPRSLSRVPVHEIIALRQEYAPARAALRAWSTALAKSLGPEVVRNKTTLKRHVRAEYEETLAPELKKLKATLSRRNHQIALSAMGLSITAPPLLAHVPYLASSSPLLSVAGGALVLAGLVNQSRQATADKGIDATRACYLLKVQELEPAGLATKIQRTLRRFTLAL